MKKPISPMQMELDLKERHKFAPQSQQKTYNLDSNVVDIRDKLEEKRKIELRSLYSEILKGVEHIK